jgi:hypothetical protein
MRRRDFAVLHSRVSEVIISDAASPAPSDRQSIRNGRSVTPAMGASTAGRAMGQRPMRGAAMASGKAIGSGMAADSGDAALSAPQSSS